MGRSFESIRMGVKDVSARWLKASKALKKEDQVYGQKLSEMANKHSSEASMRWTIPLRLQCFRYFWNWQRRRTRTKDLHSISFSTGNIVLDVGSGRTSGKPAIHMRWNTAQVHLINLRIVIN
jgi:hypothetical protein